MSERVAAGAVEAAAASVPALKMIGYCELDEAALLKKFTAEGAGALRDLRGEYTLVIERGRDCTVITSPVGAMQYFYAARGVKLFHGDRVIDVLKAAGLDWRWDWQSLGDLCQLENLTENATLHPDIRRVPPGSVLRFEDGHLRLESSPYLDTVPKRPSDPAAALEALNEETAFWAGDSPYLSLSGGFDSRVILSALLKQGIRPHLITMGGELSSDVRTARQIASAFGLKHDVVTLDWRELIDHGGEIAALTNGTKPACHWHTYLYPRKAGLRKDRAFFVGTLGEFARSYFFDKGALARSADLLGGHALPKFWNLKLNRHRTFLDGELRGLAPELRAQIGPDGTRRRSSRLAALCGGGFLSGLARFYFEQRVPNFYANGIRMYRASAAWRSPFHARKWIDVVWNLDLRWKLGSRWHRYAIQTNLPRLLDFPEENGPSGGRTPAQPPALYWTPAMRRNAYVTYDLSPGWFRETGIQEFMRAHADLVAELIDRPTASAILDAHRSGADRTRTLSLLMTLIRWKQAVSGGLNSMMAWTSVREKL